MYSNIKLDITSLYLYSHINSWASLPSAGKVSACNVGDLGLIPELRRSPAEGATHSSILDWRIPWTV